MSSRSSVGRSSLDSARTGGTSCSKRSLVATASTARTSSVRCSLLWESRPSGSLHGEASSPPRRTLASLSPHGSNVDASRNGPSGPMEDTWYSQSRSASLCPYAPSVSASVCRTFPPGTRGGGNDANGRGNSAAGRMPTHRAHWRSAWAAPFNSWKQNGRPAKRLRQDGSSQTSGSRPRPSLPPASTLRQSHDAGR